MRVFIPFEDQWDADIEELSRLLVPYQPGMLIAASEVVKNQRAVMPQRATVADDGSS